MLVVNTELSSDLMMAPNLGIEIVTGNYSSAGVNALYGKSILGKEISITYLLTVNIVAFSHSLAIITLSECLAVIGG